MHKMKPRSHITTCRHQPLYPAHRIGFAGTGKDSSAADCCVPADGADHPSLALDAHCGCPGHADWPVIEDGFDYRGRFPARNHP